MFGMIFQKIYNKDPQKLSLKEINNIIGIKKISKKKYGFLISKKSVLFSGKEYDIDRKIDKILKN